eukprot:TRINITY_DN329_c1_g1_i2.p1 TRINITY_DN329_c1_g1~~TRINITY_DN329_c1_g1_i2.p1  ORF type:complete len:495 (+),score=142.46 TRINITY_DN329_c1_g1_i2:59-1486(+)
MADDVSMTLMRFLMLADTNQQEEIEDVLPTVLPLVICGVCTELLTEPRSLVCGHTFCTMCLQNCKVKNVVTCRLCGHNETLELGKGIFGLPIATTIASVTDKIRKDPSLFQSVQEVRQQQLAAYTHQTSAPTYDDEDEYEEEQQQQIPSNSNPNYFPAFQSQSQTQSYPQSYDNSSNSQQFTQQQYNQQQYQPQNPDPMYPGYPSLSSSGNNYNNNNNTEEEAFKQFLLLEKTNLPNHQVASPVQPTRSNTNNNNNNANYSPQSPPTPPRGSDYARQHNQLQQQQQSQSQPQTVTYQKPLPPPDVGNNSAIPAQYSAYHQNALQQQQQQQQTQVQGQNLNTKQKYQHQGPINFAEFEYKPSQVEEMVKKWTRSLWFTPSGFHQRVIFSPIQPVYIPYFFFSVTLHETFSGQICHISTDHLGRKSENWTLSTGTRTSRHPDNLKLALRVDNLALNSSPLDPDYMVLLNELKNEPWF